MEKKYIISVDGGGTKTEFCILELGREIKKTYSFGSSNYKTAGAKAAEDHIILALEKICEEQQIRQDELVGMVMGLSGCDTKKDHEFYEGIIGRTAISRNKVFLCNDSELLLLSTTQPPGIGIIAGTGSIAVGFDREGKRARSGGWGSPFSDLGSGYYIASKVLTQWIRYCDNLTDYQPIFDKLYEFYEMEEGIEIQDTISTFGITKAASCAKIITNEADMQEGFCRNIVEEAAYHTAELAYGVYKSLMLQSEKTINFVMAGSIFKSDYYMKSFKNHVDRMMPETKIAYIVPKKSPADAGIELAKRLFVSKGEYWER